MSSMFNGATAFNQPIGTWTLNAAVNLTTMLDNSGMDCDNYSATLIGWSGNPLTPNNRSLGATGRQYGTNAVAARTNLDIAKSWTISGDAEAPMMQACPLVLPVELVRFNGKATETGVLLEWETASEFRNEGFQVERSTDGIRFEEIGFVPGNGTTNESHDYAILDEKPLPGVNYYRLRQVDFDGGEEFSKVVSVDFQHLERHENIRIFPNPVSGGKLSFLLPEDSDDNVLVQLFDQAGRLVGMAVVGSGMNSLDVNHLIPGIYMLRTERHFAKVILQN